MVDKNDHLKTTASKEFYSTFAVYSLMYDLTFTIKQEALH